MWTLATHGVMEPRWVNGALLFTTDPIANHSKLFCSVNTYVTPTVFVVSSCSKVNYQHWQEGEPNNHNNDENCVEFRTYYVNDHGSWNDANCEGYNDWFCQILAGTAHKCVLNAYFLCILKKIHLFIQEKQTSIHYSSSSTMQNLSKKWGCSVDMITYLSLLHLPCNSNSRASWVCLV